MAKTHAQAWQIKSQVPIPVWATDDAVAEDSATGTAQAWLSHPANKMQLPSLQKMVDTDGDGVTNRTEFAALLKAAGSGSNANLLFVRQPMPIFFLFVLSSPARLPSSPIADSKNTIGLILSLSHRIKWMPMVTASSRRLRSRRSGRIATAGPKTAEVLSSVKDAEILPGQRLPVSVVPVPHIYSCTCLRLCAMMPIKLPALCAFFLLDC